MEKFTITINMDNAAFDDEPGAVLADMLRDIAKWLENGDNRTRILDANGNPVGRITYE